MHYLSSFGFFSAQIVSKISHVARYAPSFTSNFSSKINPKSKQLIFRTHLDTKNLLLRKNQGFLSAKRAYKMQIIESCASQEHIETRDIVEDVSYGKEASLTRAY